MDLNDLYKLAGIPRDDTPAIEPQPVEQPVAEQPMDGRDDMKAMIALVTPEQLNQLVGDTPVEEEGFANSGEEYAGEPEEYKGTLGSPADLSLRRYLGANGVPVNVDETKVYEDYKVEDITEAWKQFKAEPVAEHHQKDAEGNTIPHDDEVAEAVVDEDDVEEDNAFNSAAANAKKAGKKSFSFNGKTYPVKIDDKTADALTDSVVAEGMMWKDDIPDELMMVIKKYDITPDDAEQMATRDMNADIDAIANLHDQYLDRIAKEGKITPDENGQFMFSDEEDELHDIDMGEEWMSSPEYDKVMTMMSELCSAMGMVADPADHWQCGSELMKYIDEGATAEEVEAVEAVEDENISMLRKLAGI